jgi:hypothetical protein
MKPAAHVLPAGEELVRCHDTFFGSTEFNPDPKISQRFRPFTAQRRTVPTLYAATTFEGALSETLFHAVPVDGPDRSVRLSRFATWCNSRLRPKRDLLLADLTDAKLPALGITRDELIGSPATSYPETARWAKALFECDLEPDGLVWNSRLVPSSLAVVLFGRGRVSRMEDLESVGPLTPMSNGRGAEMLEAAAERMGILLVR